MNKEAKVTIGNTTETIEESHKVYMQAINDVLNNSNSDHFPREVGEVMHYTNVLAQRIEDLELELKIAAKETENLQHAFHVFSNFIDENHNNVITAEEVLDMELGNLSELDN